jgi:threonine/homoserine/homoserine lactone efflux protein
VPHLIGICCGVAIMVLAVGMGLHVVFETVPVLQVVLKYLGAAYLAWLAWKLANAKPMGEGSKAVAKPMGFVGAAAFQWLNPKAWMMVVSAVTNYLPHGFHLRDVLIIAAIFIVIGLPCVGAWASFGANMQRVLRDPKSVRIFNLTMAALLLASLYPVLVE